MKSNNKKGEKVLNKNLSAAKKKLKTVDVQLKNTNHLESKEHKKTKKSLRKSEEHYRFLFENMLNGFAYCQMLYENGRPKDFIYLNVNKTFESLTGLKNVIGRKVTDVIPRIRESDNDLFEIYSRVALTGKPENFEMFVKSLNDWYSISVYSPKKEFFIAIFDVITERKRTEEALQKSETRFRQTLDNMLEGCMLIGYDWRYLYLNVAAANHGHQKRENLIGKTLLEMYPGVEKSEIFAGYKQCMEERISKKFECSFTFSDGSINWYSFSVQPVPEGIFVLSLDITERKHAEIMLKESQEKIQKIFDSSPDAISLMDLNGIIIESNQIAVNILGCSNKEELIGTNAFNFIVESDRQRATEMIQELLSSGTIHDVEFTMLRRDGSQFVAENAGSVFHDSSGKPIGLILLTTDITERKQNEEAFRESEDRYRDLVENSSDLICTHDLDGNILSANNAAIKITGYSQEELKKMNMQNLLVPEYQRNFKAYLAKIKTVGSANGLMTIQTKTGERRIWEYNNTLRTEGIAKPVVRGMVRDITERKHAEKILRETQEKIQKIFDSSPDAIWMNDLDGAVIECNQTTVNLLGYLSREELIGKSGYNFIVESERQHAMELMQELFTEGTIHGIELTMLRKDGTTFLTESAGSVLRNSSGGIFGIVVITKDITERKRAEVAIRESEERFRHSFDYAAAGVCIIGVDKKIQRINNAFKEMIGYEEEEIKNFTFSDITHPDDVSIGLLQFKKMFDGEIDTAGFEKRYIRKDKRIIWAYVSTSIVRNDHHQPQFFITQIMDITDRKLAEEELHIREAYLSAIIENQPGLLWLKDTESRFLAVNNAFAVSCGEKTSMDIIGKTDLDIWPCELAKKYIADDALVMNSVQSISVEELINDKGETKWFETFKTPVKDANGKIIGTTGYSRDITERKRAEEEIVSQKNKFEQLFENSPIAIALLDDQDKVVQINESFSALFGYFLEEIKGQSLNDIIVPTELKEEAISFSVQTLRGNYINKESYRMKKDSTLIYVQYVGVPVIINDKTVSSYALYVDLTQRKDSEDRMKVAKELAEQSDKLKSEFLAQMSHEIRTPINAIVGNVDFLNDLFDESMDADTRDCFDGIGLASKRIIRTVDLILNVSELQTSGYKPYKVKVDLDSEILNKLYKEHQLSAKEKGLELIYKRESKDTKIIADLYSVTQIFANLIDNAIKYTKKGKVEVLLTKNKNGNVVVEIKDTGIGMSKEFLPKIFEPFVQEEHGFTRSYDGSGLGLTLVKNYCETNNAVIEVESEKNVGTTFRVIFK